MITMLQTAERLRQGLTTPDELIESALIRARNSKHIFISTLEQRAIADAKASTQRWREGTQLSALDGIPYAVKDLLDVAGSRTTAGSITRIDAPMAAVDAAVIAALTAQGMIPMGKTNLTEFAYSGLGLNPHFGTPVSDLMGDDSRVPGGSSSGSAIAVQRGIVSSAIGTDTAGSIRIPAAFNGLVGYKASTGRYSMAGVHPLAVTLDSLGSFARTVADCAALDAAMRGFSGVVIQAANLSGLRFLVDDGVMADPALQPAVHHNLVSMMERLREAGAQVEYRTIVTVAHTRELISRSGWLGAIEAWRLLGPVVEGPLGARMDRRVQARLRSAKEIDLATEARIRHLREGLMAAIEDELDGAILVMPTVKHVAPPMAPLENDDALFAAVNLETLSLTMIGSLLDMPGVAIPSGKDSVGLATSTLFSTTRGHDDQLLSAALAIESTLLAAGFRT
ncbi:amidase family protein [Pseudomonas ogarae]|uniref:Indoleacetamide hydrolase n=1 Tax=Pseudomonas ogarae (strain DSM 112162 / CECT 30235 / F113) TaxID=1114970 RepID=A0ABM6R3K5_PSEO1|nr:amidase family protein [Pseudomonas ogarae]AEV63605.1 Asp-tRNAAsn/Glu-tRNAGln amidotransferase A subunit-related amidase [Pseudomonas ogarae]AUO47442.1 indoleacetamide hydrolase [Pseudomonas ogarae]